MSAISKEAVNARVQLETRFGTIFGWTLEQKRTTDELIQQAIDASTAPLESLLREGLLLRNDNRGHKTELERWQSKVRKVIKPAPVAE